MTWTELFRDTFRAPNVAYRRVLDLNLASSVHWQALSVTVILSAVFSTAGVMRAPDEVPPFMAFMASPLQNLFVQALFNILFVFILSAYLRFFGGRHRTTDITLATAWTQAIMLVLLVLQILLPPVAGLIGLVGFILYPWLLSRFTAEAAGFAQPFGAFLLIFSALFTAALATSIVMLSTGIVRPEDINNV